MEEQRRQVAQTYKFQMSECTEQIKAESSASAIHYSTAVMRVIDQLGTPKANKMKCFPITAEKRVMEEQRLQLAQAYKFQMSECGKQIKDSASAIHYSSAVSRARLIEQIGTLKANTIKCLSSTAEKREMEEQSQAYAPLIEQIGNPKAHKMKGQAMLCEVISGNHSKAEKRETEEQQWCRTSCTAAASCGRAERQRASRHTPLGAFVPGGRTWRRRRTVTQVCLCASTSRRTWKAALARQRQ
jgi:hypothetical protein